MNIEILFCDCLSGSAVFDWVFGQYWLSLQRLLEGESWQVLLPFSPLLWIVAVGNGHVVDGVRAVFAPVFEGTNAVGKRPKALMKPIFGPLRQKPSLVCCGCLSEYFFNDS